MTANNPPIGTIVVTHQLPRGVLARVDGRSRWFPDLRAVFAEACRLLEKAQDEGHHSAL